MRGNHPDLLIGQCRSIVSLRTWIRVRTLACTIEDPWMAPPGYQLPQPVHRPGSDSVIAKTGHLEVSPQLSKHKVPSWRMSLCKRMKCHVAMWLHPRGPTAVAKPRLSFAESILRPQRHNYCLKNKTSTRSVIKPSEISVCLPSSIRIILPSRWKVKSRCRTPETLPIGIIIILSWCL